MSLPRNAKEQRRDNAFEVLKIIRESEEGVSRKMIKEKTGLSYPSVNDIAEYLESFHLAEKVQPDTSVSRSSLHYRFSGSQYIVFGLSIVSGQITGLSCTLDGSVLNRFEALLSEVSRDGFDFLVQHFLWNKKEVEAKGLKVLAMGIGVPGLIDRQSERVLYAAMFHELESVNLKKLFSDVLDIPVFIEHNPNVAAFAERMLGIAKPFSDFLYITLDSGIGGSLFHNNKLFRGSAGFLGELGHSSVNPDGLPCECGSRGCLELYAGLEAVSRYVKEEPSAANELNGLEKAVHYLAPQIGSLVCFLGIGTVVFSGRTLDEYPELFYKLRKFLLTRTLPVFQAKIHVLQSRLGADAFSTGAAFWAGEIALSNLSAAFFGCEFPELELKLDGVMSK